jgi:hypothetical protein
MVLSMKKSDVELSFDMDYDYDYQNDSLFYTLLMTTITKGHYV